MSDARSALDDDGSVAITLEQAAAAERPGRLAVVARVATRLAGAALIGLVLVEAWQVFARYVLNDSPGWTEPLALLLLNAAMSLGAAAGVRSQSHFGFFILAHALPARLRAACQFVSDGVIACIGVVLAGWGSELFVDGISIPMAGTSLPQSAVFLPMAVGGALIALFALERLAGTSRSAAQPAAQP
ncbi:MAG: TRAP transporter small permease [Dokdonella sp.]